MNAQLIQMFKAADGRYLTKSEGESLRGFASELDHRLRAMEEVAAKEAAIVGRTMRDVLTLYPDFKEKHRDGETAGHRDLTFVLRYSAHAVVRQDESYLDQGLLIWLRTILRGIGFTQKFISDVYGSLERAAAAELTPPTMQLLRPLLTHATQYLSTAADAAASAQN